MIQESKYVNPDVTVIETTFKNVICESGTSGEMESWTEETIEW